jgi:arylsulfatase B
MDRLASEGLELNRFYVCPVCTPTRAGLMTGRYPIRYGLMRAVIPPWRDYGLDVEEQTLADLLRDAGYTHRIIIGKWHLGHLRLPFYPLNRGFTGFYGHLNGAINYFTHEREGELDWHRQFESCYDEGYSTDLLAAEAVRFIQQSSDEAPFFLYLPFNAPHSPLQAKQADLERYAHLEGRRRHPRGDGARGYGQNDRQTLAAMVSALDTGIGQILDALEQAGIAGNTIVWFTSDNGGQPLLGSDNTPLRGGKTTVYEGGIRVAASLCWPGGLPGGRRIETPLAYIDVLPTLLGLAGITERPAKNLDGRDMAAVLRGTETPPQRELYSYIAQENDGQEHLAVRTGEWKLVYNGPGVRQWTPGPGAGQVELFRIDEDPLEQNNLADDRPGIVRDLMTRLQKFRALRPEDGIPPYAVGREGFIAPPEWKIPE